MIKQVPLRELRCGMYVVEITGEQAKLNVRHAGLLTSEQTINELKKKGVTCATVDFSRSMLHADDAVAITDEPQPKKSWQLPGDPTQARKLYQEAKSFMASSLEKIQVGEALDIQQAKALVNELLEVTFADKQSMLCMIQLKNKDDYLLEHSINVGILLGLFASTLKLSAETVMNLSLGGLLHDLGKVKTPDGILKKPGRLTPEEYKIMKRHAANGVAILEACEGVPKLAFEVTANHHERLNGKGYPRKLSGDQLSLYTRMIGIVDCYDAMTSSRVYRKGIPPAQVFGYLLSQSEQYDERLVRTFIKALGIYPIGSVVRTTSGLLGIVIEEGSMGQARPVLKLFYNTKHRHHIPIRTIDLSKPNCQEQIEEAVMAESYGINLEQVVL